MGTGLKYEKYIEKWKKAYEEGKSFRQIGLEDNVDAKTVNRTLSGHVTIRDKSSWKKYAQKWYELHIIHGYSKSQIAKQHNTHISTVSKVLEREYGIPINSLKTKGKKRKYEHLAKDFKDMYEAGKSLKEIADKHGINKQTVLDYLNQDDVEIRTLSQAIRKYDLIETYFDDIDSEVKAYHLGMMFGAAVVLELHNGYVVQLSIVERQNELAEPLAEALGKAGGYYIDKEGVCRYRFSSKYMYNVLTAKGMGSKGDFTMPALNQELYPAFFSGFFLFQGEEKEDVFHLKFSGRFLEALENILEKETEVKAIKLEPVNEKEKKLVIKGKENIDSLYEWTDVF